MKKKFELILKINLQCMQDGTPLHYSQTNESLYIDPCPTCLKRVENEFDKKPEKDNDNKIKYVCI
jgi:hypothetical protein